MLQPNRRRGRFRIWKKLGCSALVASCISLKSLAWAGGSVTLAWNPDPEGQIKGYKIYYGNESRLYSLSVDVGRATSNRITNLLAGELYFFAVTAYDAFGQESDFSEEITYRVPPPHQNLRISSLSDRRTLINKEITIPFVIGDNISPSDSLQLGVLSSQPGLLGSVAFSGSGSNRTVTLKPANNQLGTTEVTLWLSDGPLTTTTAFTLAVRPMSALPSVSSILSQTMDEDTPSPTIPFSVGDPEIPASDLVLFAKSSNPSLFPVSSIVLDGTGSNRTVKLFPASNQFGTATITIGVDNGIITNQTVFLATVNPINDPPSITPLAAQTIKMNTATPVLPFTIGDAETPVTNLVLTVTCNNPALVPASSVVFGGSGSNRTIRVTPALNRYGTAIISLRVNDGLLSTLSSFILTVTPLNAPPTLSSFTDITIPTSGTAGPLSFQVGDPKFPANTLTIGAVSSMPYLIPQSGILFGGSDSNRTVSITPIPGRTGTARITIQVSNGDVSTVRSFGVTVGSGTMQPATDAELLAADLSGNSLLISWASTTGGVYRLLYKTRLSDPIWLPVTFDLTATDGITSWRDSTAISSSRIFRVMRVR